MNKKDVDEVVLVGGSTRIPKVQELLGDFFNGKELNKRIHADEAVAYGATVLAAKLSGEISERVKDLVLLDVVPLSLGTNIGDGSMSVIIPRNTPIPTKKGQRYVTINDNQTTIAVDVYQGESIVAKENNWLGVFEVAVPPAPKVKSKIKVVFKVDANGILDCSGEELTTGLKKKIRISNEKQRLSKEEIEVMLKNAQKYKLQDEEYNKKVFARNALEDYIYDVKSKVKKVGSTSKGKLHQEEVSKIENAVEDASKCLDGSNLADVDVYEKTLNQLENLCVPIIAKLV